MKKPTRERLRRYRRVTIMGLGLFGGGAGAARYFAKLGAGVTVTDTASPEKLAPSVAALNGLGVKFVLGRHRLEDFTGADLVVANQAVRPNNSYLAAARAAGVPIATETGLALALCPSPWLGVSGSSGKSTTASLVAAMLLRHDPDTMLGGNIGGDLLTRIEAHSPSAPLVVELSSFQLTYLESWLSAGVIDAPFCSVLTNLTPNHLDWHADMAEYAAAKENLIRFQGRDQWTVLNVDDSGSAKWADAAPGRVVRCGLADPGGADACFAREGGIVLRLDGQERARLPLSECALLGRHNLYNAVQAAAAAYVTCRDVPALTGGLGDFPGLPHRLERVVEKFGRVFINDSKSTTPESAITALEALEGPKVLIAGGYDKQSPFEELGKAIQAKAAALVLVGAAAERLKRAVRAAAAERPADMDNLIIIDCGDDFAKAVETAYSLAPEGGAVLLSPACASYGMFVNYEERGKVFRELAAKMEASC